MWISKRWEGLASHDPDASDHGRRQVLRLSLQDEDGRVMRGLRPWRLLVLPLLPVSLLIADLVSQGEHPPRGKWNLIDPHPQRCHRASATALAMVAGGEMAPPSPLSLMPPGCSGPGFHRADFDPRDVHRSEGQIVRQRPRQQLLVVVVHGLLVQGQAYPLSHTALALDGYSGGAQIIVDPKDSIPRRRHGMSLTEGEGVLNAPRH